MPILTETELKQLADKISGLDRESLKQVDLDKVYAHLTGRSTHPIWNPFPGPQTMAYDSPADEMFFGGSAGGGKSDLILGLALTRHKKSLILRREATYLKGLSERIKELAGNRGAWRGSGWGGIMVLSDRRIIELNGCEREDDKRNFMGIPHDGLFFDELPTFTKTQFQFICGWNRTDDPKQRCRIVGAGNPPMKPEDRWVIEEFSPWLDEKNPNPARPGELRWYSTLDGKTQWLRDGSPFLHKGEKIVPKSRTFVPSRLADNPIYLATDYGARLQAMPEPLRSQLLYGDMNVGQEDDAYQVIPTAWVRAAMDRWQPGPPEGFHLTCLGVDVARGGDDQLVIAPRYHNWFGTLTKIAGKATPDGPLAATQIQACYDGQAIINIDIGGPGGSPFDILRQSHGSKVVAVNFGAGTEATDKTGKLRFTRVRSAMYWKMREALDPTNEELISLPPDPELLADLCTPRYKLLTSGIQVELKEEIKKRIGRSPDCLVAGTLIWTNLGQIAIEDMKAGTYVMTRCGWQPTTWARQTYGKHKTKTVVLSDGRTLTGTGQHPIYLVHKGFTPLDAVVIGDRILSWQENEHIHQFGLTESSSATTARADTSTHIMPVAAGSKGCRGSIKKFGRQLMAQFRKEWLSTTLMRTPTITTSTIYKLSPTKNTSDCTTMVEIPLPKIYNTLPASENWRPNGIVVSKAGNGIPSTQKRDGQNNHTEHKSANNVENPIELEIPEKIAGFVLANAFKTGIGETKPTSPNNGASSAECLSYDHHRRTPRRVPIPAEQEPVSVIAILESSPAPVFNLAVEGIPEYYANGVLVHNCGDAVVLAAWQEKKKQLKVW